MVHLLEVVEGSEQEIPPYLRAINPYKNVPAVRKSRLTQTQINQRTGNTAAFWGNVKKGDDGKWLWVGFTNTNHNTVECKSYRYGEFELTDANHKSKMAHRVCLYLAYGREVERSCDVFPLNEDHLDINPTNLMVRHKTTRSEMFPAEYFVPANDNNPQELKAVA